MSVAQGVVGPGQQHGFKFIQVPINAAMPEAWQLDLTWQAVRGSNRTLMEAAAELEVGGWVG